jgi:hypothetical protein
MIRLLGGVIASTPAAEGKPAWETPRQGTSKEEEIATEQERDEEAHAIERLEQAQRRSQSAHVALLNECIRRGNGVLRQETLDEHDAAKAEVRAARADMDRIAVEIRSGKRR